MRSKLKPRTVLPSQELNLNTIDNDSCIESEDTAVVSRVGNLEVLAAKVHFAAKGVVAMPESGCFSKNDWK